jgi:ABC-type phosphate/phosphonate transport system substrate-binding protein
MKKKTLIIGVLILILTSACSKAEEQHKFDEEKLINLSLELVSEANKANSQPIYDLVTESYRKTTTVEAVNEFISFQLSKATNYDSIIKTTFSQSVHPLDKYPIASVVVLARFENGTMTYMFNYNELNEILGFSMNFQLK